MRACDAPAGTNTDKLVALAMETVALVAPKNTILLAAVVLKPVPVIVTVVPTGPLAGVKEVIKGCANVFCETKKSNKNVKSRTERCLIKGIW